MIREIMSLSARDAFYRAPPYMNFEFATDCTCALALVRALESLFKHGKAEPKKFRLYQREMFALSKVAGIIANASLKIKHLVKGLVFPLHN